MSERSLALSEDLVSFVGFEDDKDLPLEWEVEWFEFFEKSLSDKVLQIDFDSVVLVVEVTFFFSSMCFQWWMLACWACYELRFQFKGKGSRGYRTQ